MISPCQSAFVKGRLLIENVLLATELVQRFNQKNVSRRGVLKVDLRKAFDSLSWEFILRALQAANLPEIFVNWIRQCLTTTSFSINVNGSLCGYFKGSKGLRQGDPLSPYLFVIAMEVFAQLLDSQFSAGSIGHHPKAKDPRISHLAFADDVMIFFDGSPTSLQGITQTLAEFHRISGLEMNREKSGIYTAGLSNSDSDEISTYGFITGTFPFRYLGLPLTHKKLRKADYSPLLDSLSSRFNHWAAKTLSFAGRLQLISSVIYSTVNFWISAFILPKSCIKSIESLCNRFLWSGDITKKTGIKIAWKNVCLPKEEGGLGLRNFSIWNKTLNLKLVWLLFSKSDSLWVAWNKKHWLKNYSFWNVELKSNDSWIWKSLVSLRPLAKRFLRCSVKDGKTASFWFDHWLDLGPLSDFIGSDGPRKLGVPASSTVAAACYSSRWPLPSPRTRNSDLAILRRKLMETALPALSLGPDIFSWHTNSSSNVEFSSSLTWEQLRPTSQYQPWAKIVWFKGYIPKHAFTFWVSHLDRLPVRSRLAKWGITTDISCCLCNQQSETRDHLLLHCDYSIQIWNQILTRLGQPGYNITDWSCLISWLSSPASQATTLKCITTQATIFFIWKERNNRLHNGTATSDSQLFKQIDRCIRDIILARIQRKRFRNLLSLWFSFE